MNLLDWSRWEMIGVHCQTMNIVIHQMRPAHLVGGVVQILLLAQSDILWGAVTKCNGKDESG